MRPATLLVALAAAPLFAQEAPPLPGRQTFQVPRAASSIDVDAVLDEPAWGQALEVPILYEWTPGDNAPPPVATEALVTYDDDHLYVAWRAHDPEPGRIRAHLMDRDSIETFVQDDHVSLLVDTFADERRAYQFRVNPLGVQADAFNSEVDGSEDWSFDLIWDSAGRITADGYVVEIAIPLKQLRFPATSGEQTWLMGLGRSWPRNVRHRMADHPTDRDRGCGLCQYHRFAGFSGLEPGRNLELDPTATATRTDVRRDFPAGDLESGNEDVELGLTVRWGVTPSVTLIGAVDPDFSQVEADVAQLAVNERFALFFPEKRPFFLEGADFFDTPIDAVFTRTVVDPGWGVKTTGKTGPHAFGVFVTEDEVNSLILPSNQGSAFAFLDDEVTAGVLRYRRDVGQRSTLGVLYAGREGDDYHNRVGGLDGFLRLTDTDSVRLQYLRSDTRYPDALATGFAQPAGSFGGDGLVVGYDHFSRNWVASVDYEDFDPGFRADSGFVPRVDLRSLDLGLIRRLWPREGAWWSSLLVGTSYERVEDHDGELTDEGYWLFGTVNGPLQSVLNANLAREKTRFGGVLYEDLDRVNLFASIQPTGSVVLSFSGQVREAIDFANNRPADALFLRPAMELKLGRHLNLKLDHALQELEVLGGRQLFEAELTQLRAVYNFTVRSLVRAILQYTDVERDPALYSFPVAAQSEDLFTQLLFSYKVNPQTVLFLGYSDTSVGFDQVDLTRSDRTFFVKVGYAWIL
ncbi:MAG TPA: DUF5916 domain-containing protein [Thermoanaerobaculia bacterium]|nr:DUF5916 domain-containing protein [Thermoanaerobaculia bacterium]